MTDFLADRIAAVEAIITNCEAAMLALTLGGAQSYSLDTGQTKQTVTKLDLAKLQDLCNSLYNQREMLLARRNGGATVNVGGAW